MGCSVHAAVDGCVGAGHAVAPGERQMAAAGALFRNKSKPSWGKAKWPSNKHCFAFNYGEVCNAEHT